MEMLVTFVGNCHFATSSACLSSLLLCELWVTALRVPFCLLSQSSEWVNLISDGSLTWLLAERVCFLVPKAIRSLRSGVRGPRGWLFLDWALEAMEYVLLCVFLWGHMMAAVRYWQSWPEFVEEMDLLGAFTLLCASWFSRYCLKLAEGSGQSIILVTVYRVFVILFSKWAVCWY